MTRPLVTGRRLVLGGLAVTGLTLLAAATLVGVRDRPTDTAGLIRGLHVQLLVVAVPIAVLMEAAIVYAVWRFRDNEDRRPTPDSQGLELGWTVATGLVVLFVGVASYQVLAHPSVTAGADPAVDPDAVAVTVTGQQWYWSVAYPRENVSIERADRIVLPTDRPIELRVRSADVIHSFHAPALGLKQDAIPGQTAVIRTRITDPGEYRLYCAEYCGAGHARMTATIVVVPDREYQSWLDARRNATERAEERVRARTRDRAAQRTRTVAPT